MGKPETETQENAGAQELEAQLAEKEKALAGMEAQLAEKEKALADKEQELAKAAKKAGAEAPGKPVKTLTSKEARKYVTTQAMRGNGVIRHPLTGVRYSRRTPELGVGGPNSWIEAQVQAGLMVEYKA